MLFTLLLFMLCATQAHAEEFNAGIVQGLWYSQEAIFAGKTIRVYVAIRNNTGSDLSGTVEFFDNGKQIGRKNVQALNGRIIESWADWKPEYGKHELSATLSRIELHTVGAETQEVEVISALSEDTLFVDFDTDQDGIGNEEDSDDDGDDISDAQEAADGTNPLVNDAEGQENEEREAETTAQQEEDANTQEQSNVPRGLERYLTDSPAENMLSGVSTYIHDLKEDLDAYRSHQSTRAQDDKKASTTQMRADGFGEIARSSSTNAGASPNNQFNFSDFLKSLGGLALALWSKVYSFLLAVLSWLLGHPVLIQVGLLALILLSLIKLAHKFGARPKSKRM